MKITAIGAAALLVAAAGLAPADAASIKTGRWQFTTQLQSGAAQHGAGGAKATYTSCVKSDNAVPAELGPQCRLDHSEHHGERFTWSMTCSNPQSKVRSDGVAQYHGETMEATMVSRLPGAGGKATHMTQHITGRYVGPCLQASDLPMTPSHPTAPPPSAAAKEPPPGTAAAAAGAPAGDSSSAAAADTQPGSDDTAAQASPEKHAQHRREARRHHRHRRHYASHGRWYAGSAPYYSGFGPAPYSNNGP